MALIVASQHESARRLYARSGYYETARRPQVGLPGDFLLLTKKHADQNA